MRAIKIDVVQKAVYEIDITGTLDSMQEAICCEYVTHIALVNRKELLWLDDEGLVMDKEPLGAFELAGYPQVLSGHGIVLGVDPGGYNIDTRLSVEKIKKSISWKEKSDLPKASIEVFIIK